MNRRFVITYRNRETGQTLITFMVESSREAVAQRLLDPAFAVGNEVISIEEAPLSPEDPASPDTPTTSRAELAAIRQSLQHISWRVDALEALAARQRLTTLTIVWGVILGLALWFAIRLIVAAVSGR